MPFLLQNPPLGHFNWQSMSREQPSSLVASSSVRPVEKDAPLLILTRHILVQNRDRRNLQEATINKTNTV